MNFAQSLTSLDPLLVAANTGSPVEAAPLLPHMGITIGEYHLLLSAADAREVITPPPISRLPNTVAWLRGLTNVRGGLVPVVDLAAAFGTPHAPHLPLYLLISGHGDAVMGLLIDGLPHLLNVDTSRPVSSRPALPVLLEENTVAIYEHEGRRWIEPDLQRLFNTFARHVAL